MTALQPFRLASGGRVDRDRPLSFTFEGRHYAGLAGDTLASALLANGVRLVGRSFKYHRPRGILGTGVEEPNALMQLGDGARSTPNVRATEVPLFDGLEAKPVNCWPSVGFDFGGANALFARFLSAGFYYKTFMWPDWHFYERFIRKAAGLGRVPLAADPDRYETRYAHCDVLVIGAGPAGLAAARAASESGARVMLVEQDSEVGGRLLWDSATIDGAASDIWIGESLATLQAARDTQVLTCTTAIGYFDHNSVTLVERLTWDPNVLSRDGQAACRMWNVRAREVILATGAIERPIAFGGNDRPGVMLASAVRQYINRYAVVPGRKAVIFTNNDEAYATGHALLDAGVTVAAIVDARPDLPAAARSLEERGVAVHAGSQICDTRGYKGLTSVQLRDGSGRTSWLTCDLLAVSGGHNPAVHLFCQAGGKLEWDPWSACFLPEDAPESSLPGLSLAGAIAGSFGLRDALRQSTEITRKALVRCGHRSCYAASTYVPVSSVSKEPPSPILPVWSVQGGRSKAFVDFQNDVSVSDIALAQRENFVSVEHLKRYTTLGMAADQGKTSNVNAIAIMASLTDRSIEQTGTTRYRFPFTPVPLGCMRGAATGALFRPLREMPGHQRHIEHGAAFEEFGGWARPASYPRGGESHFAAEQREAALVRNAVGLFEGSPLGKIEVKGADAARFLDLIYANTMSTLAVGRCRYGLMLSEQGVIIDDGVTARLAADHFLVGTTGAGADRIAAWLEEWLQCEWPDFDVILAPVSTSWGVLTLSGPRAREVLCAAGTDIRIDAGEFKHMAFREGYVAGIPARVFRVSYTGEVSFEINVPASQVYELWGKLVAAGKAYDLAPVGVDAWMVLRTEKGYLHVGADTDGTTTPLDVGWGHVLKKKSDFVGRRSLGRPADQAADRLQLVGLHVLDGDVPLIIGSHVARSDGSEGSDGYVTSAAFSPVLGRGVAMGMLTGGTKRIGEQVQIMTQGGFRSATVTNLAAYDPDGERLNG